MKLIKKNKNIIIIIVVIFSTILCIVYFSRQNKELYQNFEVLLEEPLNNIHTIDIKPSKNNIYLTWETSNPNEMPPKMKESIELLKKVNDDCTIYIFDKDQRLNFIKKYFKKEVVDAYNSLKPGAFKADLWRYCILYKFGGIYQDIKMQPINGFKYSELLKNNKEYYVRDYDISGRGIYNAVLICKPKNQILLKSINQIIENCKNKYYGKSTLYPTGPMLLKSYFTEKEIDDLEMYLDVEHDKDNNDIHIVIFNNRPILKMYDGYRTDQQKLGLIAHGKMWDDRDIYQ